MTASGEHITTTTTRITIAGHIGNYKRENFEEHSFRVPRTTAEIRGPCFFHLGFIKKQPEITMFWDIFFRNTFYIHLIYAKSFC
ncbi:hypothetical protein X975_18770, partial [Stegodyphus mimosarum]